MKRQPMNMFAATNEDLPLFSGAVVDIEVAEFKPVEIQEEVKPMPMFTMKTDDTILATVKDNLGMLHSFKMGPVILEELTPAEAGKFLYYSAKHEIKRLGSELKQSSWYSDSMVVCTSAFTMEQPICHEFVATRTGDTWTIVRNYELWECLEQGKQ